MSEPIPESIPTSQDPRSRRPLKRRALTPVSEQAATISALFSKPDQEIRIPVSGSLTSKKQHSNAPPDIVANVQGSSAGAGSGEFHVYKASRRREYERLRAMDEDVKREEEGERFETERREREERDREKTRKNREKREKIKNRKEKKRGAGRVEELKGKDVEGFRGLKGPRVDAGGVDNAVGEEGERLEVRRVEEVGVIIHDDD